jgi:hypothetical protein
MPPEIASVELVGAALERGRKRLWARDLLYAATAGAGVIAAGVLFAPLSTRSAVILVALAIGTAAGLIWIRRRSRTTSRVAILIERGDPSLKNLIVTAEELLRHPDRSAAWISQRVFDDASVRVRAIDLEAIVPIGRALLGALAAVAIATVTPFAVRPGRTGEGSVLGQAPGAGRSSAVVLEARLEPPAYSKRPTVALSNPDRIDALAGTRLTLVAPANSAAVRVRFGDRPLSASSRPDGTHFEMALVESGYFAVEPGNGDAGRETTRLIAVTVTPDRAPTVRVERPGRDLLLPTVNHVVEIDAAASDDIAVGALALRYTRVSGSGEQFEFVEGELPLAVTRETAQNWRAHGRIPVAALGLEPGDSLVYRLTARDERPGTAGTASSDTYFVEVAGPGQVALEGFEMPPEQERYALSQQMIVVKLRRLREREKRLSAQALDDETGGLAAEQRAVRGNFIFLMGGHVEDEEEEAEHSNEIQEGRLENTARREIWRAVSFMTVVEQALAGHDTGGALTAAVKAVEALQRAFTRNRYILRTLPSRLRIDPSRRLSGDLDEVKDESRPVAPATDAASVLLSRQLLADMIELIPTLRTGPRSPQAVTTLSAAAERALAAAPGDRQWSAVAQAILRLRGSVSENADISMIDADARAVVQALLERVRQDAAVVRGGGGGDRLESAWAGEGTRR